MSGPSRTVEVVLTTCSFSRTWDLGVKGWLEEAVRWCLDTQASFRNTSLRNVLMLNVHKLGQRQVSFK